jgi:hypothetical protein
MLSLSKQGGGTCPIFARYLASAAVHLHRTAFPGTARQGRCGAVQVSKPPFSSGHVLDFGEYNYRKRCAMTNLEQTIMLEISTLPESRLTDVLKYVRFVKLGLADSDEIEKRFDESWKRVRARAKEMNITQEDIDAEIRAVREGK